MLEDKRKKSGYGGTMPGISIARLRIRTRRLLFLCRPKSRLYTLKKKRVQRLMRIKLMGIFAELYTSFDTVLEIKHVSSTTRCMKKYIEV